MKVKVCVVQESPVFFDKEKTLIKLEELTTKYAKQDCELIVFPESYIPGYPRGFSFGTKVGSRTMEGKKLYAEYYDNSISLESEDLPRLEKLAKTNNIYIVIGVTEKQETNGSLFCSMLYISPTDGLLGVHRKIKPTGLERVIWAESDGKDLVTFNTKIGKLGGLICWENYMPHARMAMYQKGIEIYIAPTADARLDWTATMKHIALEGRCFVLGCNQFFTKSMYSEKHFELAKDEPEMMCPGGSVIISPFGEIMEGPLFDKSGVLIAELDLEQVKMSRLDFDPNGHYNRSDIFEFKVNKQPETYNEKT